MTRYVKNPPTFKAVQFKKDQTMDDFAKEVGSTQYSVYHDAITVHGRHSLIRGHWLVTPDVYPHEDRFVLTDFIFQLHYSVIKDKKAS